MRHSLLLVSTIVLSAFLIAAKAKAPPSPSLEGYWKGSGIVNYRGGADRVECRVRYKREEGYSYNYSATCAMADGRYELSGSVSGTSPGRYSGIVTGSTKTGPAAGHVHLVQHGRHLSVTVASRQGSARLSLTKLSP
jgi:hypothetical protein